MSPSTATPTADRITMSADPHSSAARARAARDQWHSRALAGSVLRTAVRIGPTLLATAVVMVALRSLPTPADDTAAAARVLGIAIVGFGIAAMTTRYAARFLPLAALLKLSLVFPDAAPNRFRLAAGSSRRLASEAEGARAHGLSARRRRRSPRPARLSWQRPVRC